MPSTLTYPGVYIEEIPSGVRTIVGVATSITAFIGRAQRGPVNKAVTINSFADFERIFGGLWLKSPMSFGVRDFYLNGGSQAIIVRLFHPTIEDIIKIVAAANEVAAAAKLGTNGADAKAKAATKNDAIQTDANKSAEEKAAAKLVFDELQSVDNAATPADVATAADKAVQKATPLNPKAKIAVGDLKFEAAYEGTWGANLRAAVDLDNINETPPDRFNLTVRDASPGGATERFLNLAVTNGPRRIDKVLEAESRLIRWDGSWDQTSVPALGKIREAIVALKAADPTTQDALWALTQDKVTIAESKYARARKLLERAQNEGSGVDAAKTAKETAKAELNVAKTTSADAVSDGKYLTVNDFLPPNGETEKKGMYALEQVDLFNLLTIPPYLAPEEPLDVQANLISAAASYCEKRRAMLLVDAPKDWKDKSTAVEKFKDPEDQVGTRSRNAAIFFPRIKQANQLRENLIEEFVPSGAVAGMFARTDTQRGVWKAPAGLDATLAGVPQLSVNLTDAENGELNPLGVNCLRAFPLAGRVCWGARTLRGADGLADEYKYVPVRRTALYIEESLYRGTQWAVFEPNDEPLWAQLRLNIGSFMHDLFRQGAFQGRSPREAYFVKCDKETTTQSDINKGIVNVVVGFAPLKPAEFVVIKLQQIAGQLET